MTRHDLGNNQSIEIITVNGKGIVLLNGISRHDLETDAALREGLHLIAAQMLEHFGEESTRPPAVPKNDPIPVVADPNPTTHSLDVVAVWHSPYKRFVPTAIKVATVLGRRFEIAYALVEALGSHWCQVDHDNKRMVITDPLTKTVYRFRIDAQSRNLDGAYLCTYIGGYDSP